MVVSTLSGRIWFSPTLRQSVRVRKEGYGTVIQNFGASWDINFELVRN